MAELQLGNLEMLDIHELWKHEERDFTPWLAKNIDQLSDLLGVPIVVDNTEQKVGAYELDILGHVEESDAVVIIENQLQATNHGHLGQLITYAAGLDAAIIIWVAPDVRDEHRSAITWLNDHTDEKVSFFLVRPEAFRIDNSKPVVRFHIEASPSETARTLRRMVRTDDAPRHEFRLQFWNGLLQYLAENGNPWAKGRASTRKHWIAFPVGRPGVFTSISMAQGSKIRVQIGLRNDRDKRQFDDLSAHKCEIENQLQGEEISWERQDDAIASHVAVYRPYEKKQTEGDTPYRRELYAWIAKNLSALRAVARQFLVGGQDG